MNTTLCQCGCGSEIPTKDARGRRRRFVWGHGNKNKSNTWLITDKPTKRTLHARAAKLKGEGGCEWERIGGCHGRIDVAHVDGNEHNNDQANLLRLCRCHHRLLDNGRIDPANPLMPAFVVRGGKRRYKWSGKPA